jgi:hypothetical protein
VNGSYDVEHSGNISQALPFRRGARSAARLASGGGGGALTRETKDAIAVGRLRMCSRILAVIYSGFGAAGCWSRGCGARVTRRADVAAA